MTCVCMCVCACKSEECEIDGVHIIIDMTAVGFVIIIIKANYLYTMLIFFDMESHPMACWLPW